MRLSLTVLFCACASLAQAAPCNTGNFESWLEGVKREAAAKGISQRAIEYGLEGVSFDQGVIRRDRGQKVFKQSFEEFSERMINPRLKLAANAMRRHAGLLARIEQRFGVQAPVLVAIWGLETSFGAVTGNFPTIKSVASLAYDCRRTDMFRAELFDALRIVDRGDMRPAEMKGAWAGEIGQTQFMPSSYMKFAVDFDGDGRRDLVHSAADALASTANYLKGYGWRAGAGWEPGEANFPAIQQWNKADVYSRTIARFATRISEVVK
jgi:lytic murein transglycosylase